MQHCKVTPAFQLAKSFVVSFSVVFAFYFYHHDVILIAAPGRRGLFAGSVDNLEEPEFDLIVYFFLLATLKKLWLYQV